MAQTQFPAPPIRTPFQEGSQGFFSRSWQQWFQALTNAFNTPPVTITGSRDGNAALMNLLEQLAARGIIIDKTTP